MSNSHSIHINRRNRNSSYGKNLRYACTFFVTALFGLRTMPKPTSKVTEKDRQQSINEMLRLAKQFEASMPNQAAELRDLAARDPAETSL